MIVTNREGLAVSHYVDTDTLLTLPGFINLTDSDAVIKVDTEDYEIEQYPGKWRSVDYLIFEGKSYFLMENQKYGKDTAALVLNQYGKVILDECKDGFDQDIITVGIFGYQDRFHSRTFRCSLILFSCCFLFIGCRPTLFKYSFRHFFFFLVGNLCRQVKGESCTFL